MDPQGTAKHAHAGSRERAEWTSGRRYDAAWYEVLRRAKLLGHAYGFAAVAAAATDLSDALEELRAAARACSLVAL